MACESGGSVEKNLWSRVVTTGAKVRCKVGVLSKSRGDKTINFSRFTFIIIVGKNMDLHCFAE
ncbi:hypothetical protein N7462_007545 [Penicillium macrosclerotiorum]|uniref:uncharacterized protein n=1 Tax=Penicillium macrosclerotiorum TaxID=303699 RepID=UPI002547429B|nr:uncharacterized protein N7462_007545 [Penicillium macrosclerotiorum]KAJ5679301.1 hypothetical protein N7462_007545 [Penicillium macrosclerotiorum]